MRDTFQSKRRCHAGGAWQRGAGGGQSPAPIRSARSARAGSARSQADRVAVAGAELDDRVVGAHPEAVVALEAVAAGQAAAGLELRGPLVQPADHLSAAVTTPWLPRPGTRISKS